MIRNDSTTLRKLEGGSRECQKILLGEGGFGRTQEIILWHLGDKEMRL